MIRVIGLALSVDKYEVTEGEPLKVKVGVYLEDILGYPSYYSVVIYGRKGFKRYKLGVIGGPVPPFSRYFEMEGEITFKEAGVYDIWAEGSDNVE